MQHLARLAYTRYTCRVSYMFQRCRGQVTMDMVSMSSCMPVLMCSTQTVRQPYTDRYPVNVLRNIQQDDNQPHCSCLALCKEIGQNALETLMQQMDLSRPRHQDSSFPS